MKRLEKTEDGKKKKGERKKREESESIDIRNIMIMNIIKSDSKLLVYQDVPVLSCQYCTMCKF